MKRPTPMILFTGFLGSGKTTLLLSTAKYLSEKGIKCAIIVNEAGEIGVDNLQMKKLGYDVWELFGGCICCTLSSTMEETLHRLEEYPVDVILTEPSGAADPSAVYHCLTHAGYAENDMMNYFILDALRIGMLTEILEPLLASSLPFADMILINKIDLASESELTMSRQTARKYNRTAEILEISMSEAIPAEYFKSVECFIKGN